MGKDSRPGFRFKDGKLLILAPDAVIIIESWPEITATWAKPGTNRWKPFVPIFRLLRPPSCRRPRLINDTKNAALGPSSIRSSAVDPDFERQRAFNSFRYTISPDVADATERFRSRQWNVLRVCQRTARGRELMVINPALGFCLANLDSFRATLELPDILAGRVSGMKQRELLAAMGFPGTESCARIFSRIIPEAVHVEALAHLRDALKAEEAGKFFSHLPRISAGALALVGNPRFLHHVTPNLLSEVASSEIEDEVPRTAVLLQDLQQMWSVLSPGRPEQRFQSVASLRGAHFEVSAEYCAKRRDDILKCQFPAPPLPGTEDIVALTTAQELVQEGREQMNCVATYARWVETGGGYIYRVLRPERATIAVERGTDGNWQIQQIRGKHNAEVTEETGRAVEKWLRDYSVSV